MDESQALASRLRAMLLYTLVLGSVGVAAELVLTEHTHGFWQLIPLILIALSMALLVGLALFRMPSLVRAFQVSMALCIASGFAGLVLHYQAKMEFKLEIDPSLHGWELVRQTLFGTTMPPILAPGVMFQLGLLGLAYAYRHPASSFKTKCQTSSTPTKV